VQDAAWATHDTLSTGQAIAILDWLSAPGMPAHIDIDWATKCTNPALNTTRGFRDDISTRQGLMPAGISMDQVSEAHRLHHYSAGFRGYKVISPPSVHWGGIPGSARQY